MKPQRIQLRRTKGFNLQATSMALNGLVCAKVDRNTDYGNPYSVRVDEFSGRYRVDGPGISHPYVDFADKAAALAKAVELFKAYCPPGSALATMMRRNLRGVNVGCWCGEGEPCHAFWVLEIANG